MSSATSDNNFKKSRQILAELRGVERDPYCEIATILRAGQSPSKTVLFGPNLH